MKQKKILAVLTAVMLLVNSLGLTAFAAGTGASDTVSVYVTISDGDGKFALAQEKIEVTDRDGDGKFTIDEALYAAHEVKYEGGAAAGYASSSDPTYGLNIHKLWGVANGGSYGYYINNNSAWNLADLVQEGDCIKAFIYQDPTGYSDSYSYFDKEKVSVNQNEEVSLMLTKLTYDEEWNLQPVPATNAVITINGKKTDYQTDTEGKVTLKLTEAGTCVISAVSDSQILVPPVCIATVKAVAVPDNTGNAADTKADSTQKKDDTVNTVIYGILMIAAFATVLVVTGREKKYYEK